MGENNIFGATKCQKRQPMRSHEHIIIFSKPKATYNEQKTKGEPYSIHRKLKKYGSEDRGSCYGEQKDDIIKENTGFRHARSVIKISNPRIRKSETGGHPTQKPEELMSYMIKTYSNEGDVVLDCCMGSGTTGVVAIQEGRFFIGIENDEKYFEMAAKRIKNLQKI